MRGGAAALTPEELEALSAGDVMVLDGGAEPRALVLPGGARLSGRLEDEAFHVEEVEMTQRIAQLPVVLEVELARVEMTLAELARLEPGATLPLALDRRGLVTLRAGERAVARGELVDVDGAVGVRIIEPRGGAVIATIARGGARASRRASPSPSRPSRSRALRSRRGGSGPSPRAPRSSARPWARRPSLARRRATPAAAPILAVVSRASLARDAGVALVEIGGRRLLVGYGSAGVHLLADAPAAPAEGGAR